MPGRSTGRPPKPTVMRLLEGNPGKRPLPTNEPLPAAPDSLDPPEWLDEIGAELWRQLTPELARLGLLTVIDIPLFAIACDEYSLYRRASRRTARGITQKKAGGMAPRPELAMRTSSAGLIRQILSDFGVTPTARARLGVVDARAPEDSFDDFLRGKPQRTAPHA